MIPQEIEAAVAALRERHGDARLDVRWHASLPSTMDAAAALAHEGAAHGVIVVADEQTQGRGRRGTAWASPAGAGLYFSFIARPDVNRSLSLLTPAFSPCRYGRTRSSAIKTYSAEISDPNHRRPVSSATFAVVPLPIKQS